MRFPGSDLPIFSLVSEGSKLRGEVARRKWILYCFFFSIVWGSAFLVLSVFTFCDVLGFFFTATFVNTKMWYRKNFVWKVVVVS